MFDQCTSTCGYFAALVACLSFGSFCVPIKGRAASSVDIDPLVFTSYNTFYSLVTSVVFLLIGGNVVFTPWGIVSGLFWVPAGVARVCAIRTAGLVISQGTVSSMFVFVSFTWGVFIFEERVKSMYSACFAIILMIIGICGMSYFSSPSDSEQLPMRKEISSLYISNDSSGSDSSLTTQEDSYDVDECASEDSTTNENNSFDDNTTSLGAKIMVFDEKYNPEQSESVQTSASEDLSNDTVCLIDYGDKSNGKMNTKSMISTQPLSGTMASMEVLVYDLNRKYGVNINVRQLGIAMAAFGGAWGGSVMVPLHYAGEKAKGTDYFFSFAAGSSIVNLSMWLLLYCHNYWRTQSINAAYRALPPLHLKVMVVPGAISGVLLSLGYIASILSVTYLGEGIGFSITQSAILVSGLWGIFWFREITSERAIKGWMLSAIITLLGIILLGFNHLPPETGSSSIDM